MSTSAAVDKGTFFWRKGQPEGAGCIENSIEDAVGRVGNPHHRFGDDDVVGRAGAVPFKRRSGRRLGDLVFAGLGFRGNGIAWLLTRGLVLLFA